MRPIGFSTGAISYGNFQKALEILHGSMANAVELSALRMHELEPLATAIKDLNLSQFVYISVHAPSSFEKNEESNVLRLMCIFADRGWPIVVHPDVIKSFERWRDFGRLLFIENMDSRKPIGRTASELEPFFERLPDARLCFDIAHAREYDSSMNEAYLILRKFGSILGQIHISEVCTCYNHVPISSTAEHDFQKVASLIPLEVPIIIETQVKATELDIEMKASLRSLSVTDAQEKRVLRALR